MLSTGNTKNGLFLLISFCCFSQLFSQSKLLRGQVNANEADVTGVVIQNRNANQSTITDDKGNFSVKVALNDTLIFSAVQFKRKVLPVNRAIFETTFLIVNLEAFVNELREVVVQPYDLSGSLGSDITKLNLEKDVSAEALGLPNAEVRVISQSENKLNDADHSKFLYFYGIGFAVNVNKILNRLSGRTKKMKERVALDKSYERVKQIEKSFIDSLLVNHLKIPKKNFYDFIYFCGQDKGFKTITTTNDELKLWQFLIDKSKGYRKNKGLD
ncbi:hypothetical protein [Croceitalea rosinachiae]|uniref:CarboxypepD_reg-like domain-containing protein n=1 Tax=Croceitalea rosinachiae TaxID=3075596 RepID=A0ABU3AI86_9FLAO|nr:hypothetical protein [Croceitalea sp. F388]MDT0608611.1 hypothetical protein [Croceitalea sp. F388]